MSNLLKAIDLLKTIESRIEQLSSSERVTKEQLGHASREILIYMTGAGENDIAIVNRLLEVLTPMNRKTALLFFKHFLPFKEEDGAFTTKMKGEKKLGRKATLVADFLVEEANTIWTWAAENVTIDKAPTPFSDRIKSLIGQALNGTKRQEAIPTIEIMAAVMSAGITVDDVLTAADMVEENSSEPVTGIDVTEKDTKTAVAV